MPQSEQGISGGPPRWRTIPRSLCFVRHADAVLLLKGAPTKRLWPNRYNGLGGHVEAHEDVLAAARREIHEEAGLTVHDLRLNGVILIDAGDPLTGIMLFVCTAWSATRAVTPSPEGTLEWAPCAALGTYALVEDLAWLLPFLLARPADAPPFSARYSYDAAQRLVITLDGVPQEFA